MICQREKLYTISGKFGPSLAHAFPIINYQSISNRFDITCAGVVTVNNGIMLPTAVWSVTEVQIPPGNILPRDIYIYNPSVH